MALTRSVLLHLQSEHGGREVPASLTWTEEMTLSLIFIGAVLGLYSIYLYLLNLKQK